MNEMKFVLRRASNRNDTEVITIRNLNGLLKLIDVNDYPIIVRKNRYLEEYERDRERFEREYIQPVIEKVRQWKQEKAYHEIIIYDDYIE